MDNRERNSRSKYIRRRKIAIGAALAVCLYFAFTIIGTQIAIYKERQELEALNRQIESQQLENDELSRIVENGGEDDYTERVAREKLGYASIDERVFVDLAGQED